MEARPVNRRYTTGAKSDEDLKLLEHRESEVHANEQGHGSFHENFGVFPAQSHAT
jgi:hypothetical protein